MACFHTIVFYLESNGREHVDKSDSLFSGRLSTFVEGRVNLLRSAPFVAPHARDDMTVKASWWGQDHWEDEHDYKVGDAYEGCALILVDDAIVDKSLEYFQLCVGALLMQSGRSPKKPSQPQLPDIISLKPGWAGLSVDLRALFRTLRRRWSKTG